MPDKSNNNKTVLKLILFFSPPLISLIIAWLLSIHTPYFKSLGQVLLTIIITSGLLSLGIYLSLHFIRKQFINPVNEIVLFLQSVLAKNPKTPSNPDFGIFNPIYLLVNQLNQRLNQDQATFQSISSVSQSQAQLFETATLDISDPLIVLNSKFQVKYLNKSAENFAGIKKMDVLGKRIDQFIRIYDKANQEILPSVYAPANSTETKLFAAPEVKVISAINKQVFADISVFRPMQGNLIDISCLILFQDKSREKQLEAMKLDFVSMAAHELRTPLTTIKGYISVFINENKAKLTPDQMMFVDRINTSTLQLSGLVENLLSVARVERGAMSLHTQVVDWADNVKRQVEVFERRAQEKRIDIKYIEPDKKMPSVQVDLVRMNEVLNNIISNAINYTEPGGKIQVWLSLQEDLICTNIKDTGKGIPKEALAHLFSKFFRVQGGPAEQASKGNGLGLYLSKAIVELHNGKIWADSEGTGKGSTFSFCLPAISDKIDVNILTKTI